MNTTTEKRIRHLPVVDKMGKLLGIISVGDVIKILLTHKDYEINYLRDYIENKYPVQGRALCVSCRVQWIQTRMHEAAIIEDLIRQVLQEAEKNRLVKISIIHLAIGRLHHLVQQTMSELFDLMKREFPIMTGAILQTEICPLRFVCRSCGKETEADAPFFSCPACRSTDIQIISGYELILAHIEGEQNE